MIPEARQRAAALLVGVLDGRRPEPLEVVALCAAVLEETDDLVSRVEAYTMPGLRLIRGEEVYSAEFLSA